MATKNIVIIGGGTGGTILANILAKKLINKLATSEYNNAILQVKIDELTQEVNQLKAEKENKDVKNK